MAENAKKETRVICFTNNKGGSGKSTTCANLGYELAALGKRVLLVDEGLDEGGRRLAERLCGQSGQIRLCRPEELTELLRT